MRKTPALLLLVFTAIPACQPTAVPPPQAGSPATQSAIARTTQSATPPPTAALPKLTRGQIGKVQIAEISFSGTGLDGVPTFEEYNDLNGNGIQDPGEPLVETLIKPPEYIAATGRNKDIFFTTDTRFRVKVRFVIEAPDTVTVTAFATCIAHPELNLGTTGKITPITGTHLWEGTFQISDPITQISAYENILWNWSIVVDGNAYRDDSHHSMYFTVGTGNTTP